ncbi:hypothetical protein K438DRAFT_1751293 [Mycena galopus ATCC 62051]|nr:hypothetical protein K438DRAFT_1751293 [Mycena galopus ATCC 62051]
MNGNMEMEIIKYQLLAISNSGLKNESSVIARKTPAGRMHRDQSKSRKGGKSPLDKRREKTKMLTKEDLRRSDMEFDFLPFCSAKSVAEDGTRNEEEGVRMG